MRFHHYIFQSSYLAIIFMVIYACLHFIPYSWFVDVKYTDFSDICVGDNISVVETERYARWDMEGTVWSQIVRFEDPLILETNIYRESDRVDGRVGFGYESHTTSSTYQVTWNHPFTEIGVYGVNEWVKITPIPFVTVSKFNSAESNTFNVVNCD